MQGSVIPSLVLDKQWRGLGMSTFEKERMRASKRTIEDL